MNREPKFRINQQVWCKKNNRAYYVRGYFVSAQCHPNLEFDYLLSDLENRTSATNETTSTTAEKDLCTLEESCMIDLKEIAMFYGGWDNLRDVISNLEQADNEAAYERMVNNP